MILDTIIVLVFSLVVALVELTIAAINQLLLAVEFIIRLFVSGFKIGRLKRRKDRGETQKFPRGFNATELSILAVIVVSVVGSIWGIPKIFSREVTLLAEDGHELPFATVILHRTNGDIEVHTDIDGIVEVPRFRLSGLTLEDPRYIKQTWWIDEIEAQLVARRSALGKSLDHLIGKAANHRKATEE